MEYFNPTSTDAVKRTLKSKKTWLFDLDNTLYPPSCRLFDQVDRNITNYISEYLGLEWGVAYRLQKSFFRKYGTTMHGLMIEHGINPNHFLEYVHDIDLSPVSANPDLDQALGNLSGRKIIFTNGPTDHAERVLDRLSIRHHFEDIFDIIGADYIPKPMPVAYEVLVSRYRLMPDETVMVEDLLRNLKPAAAMGMTTVWVRSETELNGEKSDHGDVHHVVDDLTRWLAALPSG